jgi:hypothetical protein
MQAQLSGRPKSFCRIFELQMTPLVVSRVPQTAEATFRVLFFTPTIHAGWETRLFTRSNATMRDIGRASSVYSG